MKRLHELQLIITRMDDPTHFDADITNEGALDEVGLEVGDVVNVDIPPGALPTRFKAKVTKRVGNHLHLETVK